MTDRSPHPIRRALAAAALAVATVAGTTALGAAPASAGSPDHCNGSEPRSFVCDSYLSFFRRQPSPAEVDYWNPRIPSQKTFFLATLGRAPESRRRMIEAYYGYFAELVPLPAEITYWEGEVLKPNGFRRLEATLLGNLDMSLESYIVSAFDTILGRLPGAAEAEYWETRAEQTTRTLTAADLAHTSEARRLRVRWAYQNELAYFPGDAGRNYWAERLRTGTSFLDLRIGLKAAPDGYPVGSRLCSTLAPIVGYGCVI